MKSEMDVTEDQAHAAGVQAAQSYCKSTDFQNGINRKSNEDLWESLRSIDAAFLEDWGVEAPFTDDQLTNAWGRGFFYGVRNAMYATQERRQQAINKLVCSPERVRLLAIAYIMAGIHLIEFTRKYGFWYTQ
jgi:hypothetical protein